MLEGYIKTAHTSETAKHLMDKIFCLHCIFWNLRIMKKEKNSFSETFVRIFQPTQRHKL